MKTSDVKDYIEIFIQGEGIPKITLVTVDPKDVVTFLIELARKHGLTTPEESEVFVFIENTAIPLALDMKIDEVGLSPRSRVHVHRCKQVEVTVNFNADQTKGYFPPSATIAWVKMWSVGKKGFDMPEVDATEHLLQVCRSTDRPDEDVHIGTLVKASDSAICFDLVAKQRVEG